MEAEPKSSKFLLSLIVGSVIGAGAGLALLKMCNRKARKGIEQGGMTSVKSGEPYCAVPEGADICYP